MADGRRKMEEGRWKMEEGRRKMEEFSHLSQNRLTFNYGDNRDYSHL